MKRAIGVLLLASVVSPAIAEGADRPHRSWGKRAIIETPLNEAQACIATQISKTGSVLMLPVDGGVDIDWTIRSFTLAAKGEPYFTFQLRDSGDVRHLTALYRRPMSAKGAEKTVLHLGKKCLKIRSIEPA